MISIIRGVNSMILFAFASDLAGAFKCGQGAVKRLVSKADFGGQILQCSAEFDVRPIRA